MEKVQPCETGSVSTVFNSRDIQLQYNAAILTTECNKAFDHLSYVRIMSEDVIEKAAVLSNVVSLALSQIKHHDNVMF